METILGLLLVLLPLVFKLVEKKLRATGKVGTAEKVHEWAEMFGKDDDDWDKDDADDADELPAAAPVLPAAPVRPVEVTAPVEPMKTVSPQPGAQIKPLVPRTRKQVSRPLIVEEDKQKNKEKIDPKKLVIYSEIMKQKF